MKILLLNQPVYNRGDEAAHRSLIRTLNKNVPNASVMILLENVKEGTIKQIKVDNPQNKYININTNKGYRKSRIFSACSGMMFWSRTIPSNRKLIQYIQEADVVLCAPGGICLGGFYNWSHLYNMMLCKHYNKPVIYYSRSIGPFNPRNILQHIFCTRAKEILKKMDFLSLRDARSMDLANKLGIKYIKSIDSAFLDTPDATLPDSVRTDLGKQKYIVFVPNQLTWHPSFANMPQDVIDKCYLKMIDIIIQKTDYNIVMLPQLYNAGKKNDCLYFKKLKEETEHPSRIIVFPDTYSSDIQQIIIKDAQMIIGTRYHSIVFGINNRVPVIALSYEHKIAGMLEILGIKGRSFEFNTEASIHKFDFAKFEQVITGNQPSRENLKEYADHAHAIAMSCFSKASQLLQ